MRTTTFRAIFPDKLTADVQAIQTKIHQTSHSIVTTASSNKDNLSRIIQDLIGERELKLELVCNNIRGQLPKEAVFKSSIAGQLLDFLLHEFVKNSVDAFATHMSFKIETDDTQCNIAINDNGVIPIPVAKLGKYDWISAVFEKSQKSNAELGGCHFALAFIANFLEMVDQQHKGELTLTANTDLLTQVCVTFSSSATPYDFGNFGFAGYILEIINDLSGLLDKNDSRVIPYAQKLADLAEEYKYLPFSSKRPVLDNTSSASASPLPNSASTGNQSFSLFGTTPPATPVLSSSLTLPRRRRLELSPVSL